MKTLIVAAAALGLSAASAYACGFKTTAQTADTDEITTASVMIPNMSTPAPEQTQVPPVPVEADD